ncbi:unnamed protein product, partial [Heterotrigona itama]
YIEHANIKTRYPSNLSLWKLHRGHLEHYCVNKHISQLGIHLRKHNRKNGDDEIR